MAQSSKRGKKKNNRNYSMQTVEARAKVSKSYIKTGNAVPVIKDIKASERKKKEECLFPWKLTIPRSFLSPYCRRRNQGILILGCGIAGCSTALRLASEGYSVTVLTAAEDPLDCTSYWAQGGIVYKSSEDTPEKLASDIHIAGAGKSFDPAVQMLSKEGPRCVEEILLDTANVPFQREAGGDLSVTLEASHNCARIIYKADHTGKAITTSLLEAIKKNPKIELLTNMTVFELAMNQEGHCIGAFVLSKENNSIHYFPSQATVLATGGLGDLYLNTSNPQGSQGSGIALAARVGAKLRNLEYIQFHPTTLFIPNERRFLLTEVLRGEGGKLLNHKGEAFALKYHKQGELAPRDVVTRMILAEMQKEKTEYVFLDITHLKEDWIKLRFPTIYKHCLDRGIDITKEPMPVVPAAHYHCGGVKVNLEGETSVPGLYAAGEVACTGVHGANRLASTSLLEGLVWGTAVASVLVKSMDPVNQGDSLDNLTVNDSVVDSKEQAEDNNFHVYWNSLRTLMWENVGPIRTTEGLTSARKKLKQMLCEAENIYHTQPMTIDSVSLRNALLTSLCLCEAALKNTKSLGTHYLVD